MGFRQCSSQHGVLNTIHLDVKMNQQLQNTKNYQEICKHVPNAFEKRLHFFADKTKNRTRNTPTYDKPCREPSVMSLSEINSGVSSFFLFYSLTLRLLFGAGSSFKRVCWAMFNDNLKTGISRSSVHRPVMATSNGHDPHPIGTIQQARTKSKRPLFGYLMVIIRLINGYQSVNECH